MVQVSSSNNNDPVVNNTSVSSSSPQPPKNEELVVEVAERTSPLFHAHIRYGVLSDDGFTQTYLRSARQKVPENAKWVSPVYFLTQEQEDRLHSRSRPSAKQIQKECEDDGRVAYPIVVESDDIENGTPVPDIIAALTEFIEEWIGLSDCSSFYSGNRSIHQHTGEFTDYRGVEAIKELAERFNSKSEDVEIDASIYKKKAQFRLTGVKHQKTEQPKIPISEDADIGDCIRAANDEKTIPNTPSWHTELPWPEHHDESTLRQIDSRSPCSPLPSAFYPKSQLQLTAPTLHYQAGIEDRESLLVDIEEVSDRIVYKRNTDEPRPFSPYKKTNGDSGRSVIVMEQNGGLQQDRRDGDHYVPAKIKFAVGGGDGYYTRHNSECRVYLSPKDYRKWEFGTGDHVVIIGGNSGSSRLLDVDETTARLIATALETKGKGKALEILRNRSYDVGETGYNPSQYHKSGPSGETDAARLKREIENGDAPKTYGNIGSVCCRLFQIGGWDTAYEWCEMVFGPRFDPEDTHEYLQNFVEEYDDYSHILVPDSPE